LIVTIISRKKNLFDFVDESSRKRKFNEIEPVERKKSSGIWSLADMAEKNPCRSSSSTSLQGLFYFIC
jgi:hypothetical protein